jgi:hypothetical protein
MAATGDNSKYGKIYVNGVAGTSLSKVGVYGQVGEYNPDRARAVARS